MHAIACIYKIEIDKFNCFMTIIRGKIRSQQINLLNQERLRQGINRLLHAQLINLR